jgi:hypothetical protein
MAKELRDHQKHVSSHEGQDPLLPEGFSRLQYNIALIVVTFEFTFGRGTGLVVGLMLRALVGALAIALAVVLPGLDSITVGCIFGILALVSFEVVWGLWRPINRKSAGDAVRWNVAHESPEQRSNRHRSVALLVGAWGAVVASCVFLVVTHGW